MPNLAAHIDLARQASARLKRRILDPHMGYFLLGSSSPDMRAMTKRTRQDYHFASLDFEQVGAGARALFEAHPHLRDDLNGDAPTQAFVAGYVTHLLLDEAWIVNMYRPYFGNREIFQDEAQGNVMDRVMQLELDRQAMPTLSHAVPRMRQATATVDVGFIPVGTVSDWREWVVEFVARGFTWERLRFMARRVAAGDEGHPAQELAERFLSDMPESLESLFEKVPLTELSAFKARAVETLVDGVEGYLG